MSHIQPTRAQEKWMDLGYGMFLHFGPNTMEGTGWGDGKFPPAQFNPIELNVAQWAETAAEAGMKYAVLTTKHHDGFCLWPSRYTRYSIVESPIDKDIVGMFTEEFRKVGLKVGFYYSLWDRNYPDYENDEAYVEYMKRQLTELLTQYGDIVEVWFDGGWDKDFPTRQWDYHPEWENDPESGLLHGQRWHWEELYKLIHQLQPECLVVHNSSSDQPGQVKYHPVDIRTSEHFNFVWREKLCTPVLDPLFSGLDGEKLYLPLEYCTTLTPNWFWAEGAGFSHPSVETICDWYRTARRTRSNLLLNVGPNRDGLIPDYNRYFLSLAAKKLFGISE